MVHGAAQRPRKPTDGSVLWGGLEILEADHTEQCQRVGLRGPGRRRVDDQALVDVGQVRLNRDRPVTAAAGREPPGY